jgi:light-regulated signal transduction histidine kinase (bacteriophytochrome)
MGQLIDDLLHLSRITRAPLARDAVDLSEVARSVLRDLAGRTPDRRVTVDVSDGLSVRADPGLVRVIMDNLLGNAWKFTSKTTDARIEVGRTERDGAAAFYVKDNGAGFDVEHAERLFSPFQRFHKRSDFDGTGIGLATVSRIVTRHDGRVWVDSARGKGATFFFQL